MIRGERRVAKKLGKIRKRKTHRSTAERRLLDLGEQGSAIQLAQDARLRKEGYTFDPSAADYAVGFIHRFSRHSKGEWFGQNIILQPWQLQFVRRLFGWKRPNGLRRYRRGDKWIPRKNGKSTEAAALGMLMLVGDHEPGAQVYAAASSKEQAEEVFREAKNMVAASPALDAHCETFKSSIFVPSTLSRFQVISSKPNTKHGFNPSAIILDEVHALPNRDLYDVLTTGFGARRQPLELLLSTAGDNIAGFGFERWRYCQQVIDGSIDDPEMLAVIYAADAGDDYEDPAVWRRANPNFGISIYEDNFRSALAKVKGMPAGLNTFLRLYLNIWTQDVKAAFDVNRWKAGADPALAAAGLEAFRGRKGWFGLDLSSTRDLSAFVGVFPRENEPEAYDVLVRLFCPEASVESRSKTEHVQYVPWVKSGALIATPGNVIDYAYILAEVRKIAAVCKIQEIAYDPWGAAKLVQDLQDKDGHVMVDVRQGFKSMSPPTKTFERLMMPGKLHHDGNPALTWNIANVVLVHDDAGNVKPTKRLAREKIDGFVALVMGLGRATLAEQSTSVYETKGAIVV